MYPEVGLHQITKAEWFTSLAGAVLMINLFRTGLFSRVHSKEKLIKIIEMFCQLKPLSSGSGANPTTQRFNIIYSSLAQGFPQSNIQGLRNVENGAEFKVDLSKIPPCPIALKNKLKRFRDCTTSANSSGSTSSAVEKLITNTATITDIRNLIGKCRTVSFAIYGYTAL